MKGGIVKTHKGINVPGYHLHFLSDDKKGGGHLFDFTIEDAELQYCRIQEFKMLLPSTKDFSKADFSANMTEALKKVECAK